MKRKQTFGDQKNEKKTKANTDLLSSGNEPFYLPDEMITIILSYLPNAQILRRCILVSKQWLIVCGNLNLVLNTNSWSSCGPVTLKKRLNSSFANCFTSLHIEKRTSLKDEISLIGESKLTRLQYLTIGKSSINNSGLDAFLSTPNVSHLKYLNLYYNSLKSDSTVNGFKNVPNLETLVLSRNILSKDTIRVIVDNCPKLKCLKLAETFIESEGLEIIASSENMSNLVTLDLAQTHLLSTGATCLANSPYLNNLTFLEMYWCGIETSGIKDLCESGKLKNLRTLGLCRNSIGTEGAKYIANCEDLSHLTELNIGFNEIMDEGAKAIFESSHLSKLRSLNISKNKMGGTSEGYDAMIQCKWLKNLHTFSIADNTISYYGSTLFQKCDLSSVESLDLDNTRIKTSSAKIITESDTYQNLNDLRISRNSTLDDDTAQDFANSTTLTKLTYLDIYRTKISVSGIHLIKKNTNFPANLEVDLPFANVETTANKLRIIESIEEE
ncbi:leucine rich repeat domain-containing protein [Naegleria gruberi]|uniref:Leucine rich repeat domain-containing protein n=1 Tax=Naegleria gruberi TaxID=5762 RepID=D2VBN8_NAEGR|nr:leucine rich repeat domain-containing protein [Naegleria gruberi]EFC45940.1 leucine rich repeat domain-containing protein [Naegleria gruberi]|eukprot:XP_002678684.1 leucine rich repeat domain-containing protein [Naegleria gruberi strain NEG-M]